MQGLALLCAARLRKITSPTYLRVREITVVSAPAPAFCAETLALRMGPSRRYLLWVPIAWGKYNASRF